MRTTGKIVVVWSLVVLSATLSGVYAMQAANVVATQVEPAPRPAVTETGKVIYIVDGDTVDIQITRTVRVRLLDCWAPEKHLDNRVLGSKRAAEKEAGLASMKSMQDLCLGKQVTYSAPLDENGQPETTLGRTLAHVWLHTGNGAAINVGKYQVANGFATKVKRDELK